MNFKFPAGAKRGAAVWAIDPFERTIQPPAAVAAQLIAWLRDAEVELQPVHILSLSKELGENRNDPAEINRNVKAWERACDQYMHDLGINSARPSRVLASSAISRKDEVQGLLGYAEAQNSPVVLVSSHCRTGLNRLAFGSFAETLLRQSRLPVIFMTHFGSGHDQPKESRRAVFATDFTERSHRAFHRFVGEAARLHCAMTVVHSVTIPSMAAATIASPAVIPDDYFQSQTAWAKEEGEKWVKEAERRGVPARLVVKVDGVGANVANTILSVADEENANLIAMASVSGPATSFVMGSVAREVFRSNQFPVLVYGPKAIEEGIEKIQTEQAASA